MADAAIQILTEPARDEDVRKACTDIGSNRGYSLAFLLMLSPGSAVHPTAARRTFTKKLSNQHQCRSMLTTVGFFL